MPTIEFLAEIKMLKDALAARDQEIAALKQKVAQAEALAEEKSKWFYQAKVKAEEEVARLRAGLEWIAADPCPGADPENKECMTPMGCTQCMIQKARELLEGKP